MSPQQQETKDLLGPELQADLPDNILYFALADRLIISYILIRSGSCGRMTNNSHLMFMARTVSGVTVCII